MARLAIERAVRDADRSVDFLDIARQIAHFHHEKWDGSGYPEGLKGDAIPIPARLMALADVFDALISRRVYKAADAGRAGAGHHRRRTRQPFRPRCRRRLSRRISRISWPLPGNIRKVTPLVNDTAPRASGETYFFRDHGQFDLLRLRLLPELIERRRGARTLRLWSAGCASGEEAYSLAMLVDMLLPERDDWDILILGSDIDAAALAKARRGQLWAMVVPHGAACVATTLFPAQGRRMDAGRAHSPHGELPRHRPDRRSRSPAGNCGTWT